MADTQGKLGMHINLIGDQIEDYEIVKAYTGITNNNDLVRHLLREKATSIRGTFPLLATAQAAFGPLPETDAQQAQGG